MRQSGVATNRFKDAARRVADFEDKHIALSHYWVHCEAFYRLNNRQRMNLSDSDSR